VAVDTPGPDTPTPLATEIATGIATHGPMRFDAYMDVVLYHPTGGFYAAGGRAGARAGDFLTSPEVGPLFGAVLAAAVDQWWDAAGQPSAFTVAEVGAGPGTLAAAVRLAAPRCAGVLRWVMVERTAAQRAGHVDRLGAATGLPGRGGHPHRTGTPTRASASAPTPTPTRASASASAGPSDGGRVQLVSLPDLPDDVPIDVVVANELLDNLAVRVLERTSTGWAEVWVDVSDGAHGLVLVETLVDLDDSDPAMAMVTELASRAAVGQRIAWQDQAMDWLRRMLSAVGPTGRVVVFDYADTTSSMATRGQQQWMRTYAAHGRGSGPLLACGAQDLTCDVAVDQLALVRPPTTERTQAAFLAAHGIGALVDEGRRVWAERVGVGDLAAVRARSRITEAEALTDLDGLGAHRVLEWDLRVGSATVPARDAQTAATQAVATEPIATQANVTLPGRAKEPCHE
jgi:SAM-dependent MidA family methyltransferase